MECGWKGKSHVCLCKMPDDGHNSHPVELDSNIYLSLLAIIYEK